MKEMVQELVERNLMLDGPCQVSYAAYLAMDAKEADAIEDCFNLMCRPLYLTTLQKQGADWLLVCGQEVVLTSNETELPGSEQIEAIARERDRVPFIVSWPAEIEESDWHPTRGPFQRINPQREALTGRDLLRVFRLTLELDGQNQETRVYHAVP
jgi:hypothetical protein